jgi:hypothetical protein
MAWKAHPVGFQNSATGSGLGFYGARLVFVDEAAEEGSALDPLLGEVGVGPGRAVLAAAMGAASVVVGLVLGRGCPQMPLAEDQHPVGDLGPAVSTNLSA